MKPRNWIRPISGLLLITLTLLACTFTVDVLPTATPVQPTFTEVPPSVTVPPTEVLPTPSATPTLISIRDGTYFMLETFNSFDLGDVVRDFAFTPDGRVLAAVGGNSSGIVQLWDVVNAEPIGAYSNHSSIVWGADFSNDGRLLATVSSDRTAKVMDWQHGALIESLDFPGEIVSVSFSPDGQSLAVGGVAENVNQVQYASIWTFAIGTWQPLMRFPEYTNITSMAFSPKGGTLIGGGTSRNVQVWRTSDATTMFTLNHAHQVFEATVSPDGSTVATGTCITVVNSDCTEGGIWLWDLPTGKLLRKIGGFPDIVEGLAFTADGSTLIAGSRDGTMRFFSTADYISRYETVSPGGILALTLSADSGILATGGSSGQVNLWKVVYRP